MTPEDHPVLDIPSPRVIHHIKFPEFWTDHINTCYSHPPFASQASLQECPPRACFVPIPGQCCSVFVLNPVPHCLQKWPARTVLPSMSAPAACLCRESGCAAADRAQTLQGVTSLWQEVTSSQLGWVTELLHDPSPFDCKVNVRGCWNWVSAVLLRF